MDRFQELEALVALADTGSFSAAATRLGRSPAAMSRLIAGLEARLDLRLVARSTRHVALTEAGERFVADSRRVLEGLMAAEEAARGLSGQMAGRLVVTAPVLFGEIFVAPLLREHLERWPLLAGELLLADRLVDLVEEGVDLALRIGPLDHGSLMATRVGTVRPVVVAAPAYLRRVGTPRTPDGLVGARVVVAASGSGRPGQPGPASWTFDGTRGRRTVALKPALSVSTIRAAIDAARDGFGLTRVLSYQVADDLAAGRLVEVLADWDTQTRPLHLVHALGHRVPRRVRGFLDFAAARLRGEAHRLDARTVPPTKT